MITTQLSLAVERAAGSGRSGPLMSVSGLYLGAGLESRSPGSPYHWDGERRRVHSSHPYVVFQYTLSGWGLYEEDGVTHRILPGCAFAAYVPSAHVYRLPADSPGWKYFWVMFNAPHVVSRFLDVKTDVGAVTELAPDSLAVARLVRLFEGVHQGGFRDQWAQEQALFEFLWEYERHEQARRYATPLQVRLLDEVRRDVMEARYRAPDVTYLAKLRGMSRSHFSHYFRDVTGLPPAQFVTQVRLEEVTRRLLDTDNSLAEIADETGFADANHLCKVFRRHYHLSPGVFRRQMR